MEMFEADFGHPASESVWVKKETDAGADIDENSPLAISNEVVVKIEPDDEYETPVSETVPV